MPNLNRIFTVNGQPFFPLGGQSRNSSGYNDRESETAFQAVKLIHGNTLEIPVYWEQIEPQEGVFDFTSVDALLANARRYEIKLVLLWFGTWKNGNMDYVPGWVKTAPSRFKRVIAPTGKAVWVLSSHCQANLDADRSAFVALCQYLRERDYAERTVIALQVENEPGILGSDRDYGAEGQAELESQVPAELLTRMKSTGKGKVYSSWQESGGRGAGSWLQVFGQAAGEMMTAWSIASGPHAKTIAGGPDSGRCSCHAANASVTRPRSPRLPSSLLTTAGNRAAASRQTHARGVPSRAGSAHNVSGSRSRVVAPKIAVTSVRPVSCSRRAR